MKLLFWKPWKQAPCAPFTIARYDPDQVAAGLVGTRIAWASFVISEPALLFAFGGLHIRHRGIVLDGYGDAYPCYGNARIVLHQAATPEQLPSSGSVGVNNVLRLHGMNINGVKDHYAAPVPAALEMLAPSAYRVELWAGAGSDAAPGSDQLCEAFERAGELVQFHVLAFKP